ncbi:MAG: metallopeptidase TldD-related protein [Promethearchaeota archaeon]|jgi:PmbA protein
MKSSIETEREGTDFVYFIRILTQKGEETGIGIVKGNTMDTEEISKNIDTCTIVSKYNISSKYYFPRTNSSPNIKMADPTIISDPRGISNQLSKELVELIKGHTQVAPTFGRFRLESQSKSLRNSNGLDLNSLKTFFHIEFALKAQSRGKLAEYWTTGFIKEIEHLNFEARVEKWAKIAKDTLIAEPPKPSQNALILFPPHVLREALIPVIGFHSLGKSFNEKISSYNINDAVASEEISLIDNGLLKGGLNSNSWDAEGVPQQKTEIIKDGLFQNRLYDQKYAILENVHSTGNGIRSINGSVSNGVTNLQILPGETSLQEIISDIKKGYLIEKFSWLNPEEISGSFGAEIRNGYYIENGEISNPIKGGNVSGNILEMVKNCKYISKELEFSANSQFPYMAFSNLTVSY